jgi:hypothetical protein
MIERVTKMAKFVARKRKIRLPMADLTEDRPSDYHTLEAVRPTGGVASETAAGDAGVR